MIDIQQLKIRIIKLAIQGKLIEQSSGDGEGRDALASSLNCKNNAIKQKLIRKEKKPEDISEDEILFDIPDSWARARLSEIAYVESGGTPDRSNSKYWNGDIPWLKIGDIKEKYVKNCSEYITKEGLDNSSTKIFRKGTVLYTIFATIGNVGILDFDAATNQAIAGLTFFGDIDTNYMYYVLLGLKDILVSKGHGMTQTNINQTILKNSVIPIPPYKEQIKIAKKLDAIFEQLEKIDAVQSDLVSLKSGFEARVLSCALMGKLVKQIESEGTAEDLFNKIQEVRSGATGKGRAKKKQTSDIEDDEIPFEIPASWKWVRIGDIFMHNTGKALNSSDKEGELHEYITTSNVFWNRFELNNLKKMYFTEDQIERCSAHKGDLLVLEGGDIGRSAVWNYDYPICVQNHIHKLTPYFNVSVEFYYYVFYFYKNVGNINGRGIGLQGLSSNVLHALVVPLPPYNEQLRIVKKIKEVLSACEMVA